MRLYRAKQPGDIVGTCSGAHSAPHCHPLAGWCGDTNHRDHLPQMEMMHCNMCIFQLYVFVRCFVTYLPGVSASYTVFSSESVGCPSTRASWQADVLNSPLVLVARTDAEAATMIDSNIDTLQSKSSRGGSVNP